jgi:hypothetical protein
MKKSMKKNTGRDEKPLEPKMRGKKKRGGKARKSGR